MSKEAIARKALAAIRTRLAHELQFSPESPAQERLLASLYKLATDAIESIDGPKRARPAPIGGKKITVAQAIARRNRELQGDKQGRYVTIIPPDYADVMTVAEWSEAVDEGAFNVNDGHGYWARDGKMSRDEVFGTPPGDATHVAWFNK